MSLALSAARLCQSPSFLSSYFFWYEVPVFHFACLRLSHCLSQALLFGSLFLSLAHRCLMMVIFYPGPSVSWCGEALGPPLFLMRHDGKLPRALCCQIVTHCLVVISRQTPACVFTHTRACRHLWLCALITLCEITTVTTAVWATPCFPGHLGHQLPITATAPSLSDTTADNESSPCCACCSDTTETLPPSITFFHLLSLSILSFPSTLPGCRWFCVCERVCVATCGVLTDMGYSVHWGTTAGWVDGGGEGGGEAAPVTVVCHLCCSAVTNKWSCSGTL